MTPEVKERIEQIRHGNVPEGYRKTAVGIAPNDWKERKLGDVAVFLDDRRIPIKENERKAGKYPYYGASGVIDHVADYIFDGEYILLGEDGANIIERSSPLAFRVSGKCWINNHAHVLCPKEGYHIDYLTNYLESLSYVKYNSGTAQPKLNQDTCQKLPVVCGDLAEQERIAEILSTQDVVIILKERLLTDKQRQKKYLMQQLLTGRVRLPGYSKKWATAPIGDFLESRNTKQTPSEEAPLMAFVAGEGVVSKGERYDRSHLVKDNSKKYKRTELNDFIYSSNNLDVGSIGVNTYGTAVISGVYEIFKIKKDVVPSVVSEVIQLPRNLHHILSYRQGAFYGQYRIYAEDFLSVPIAMPSYDEQLAIGIVLESADKEIDLIRRDIEQEKQKKKALMQLLLTGIVRV